MEVPVKIRQRTSHRLVVGCLGLALLVAACSGAPVTPAPGTGAPEIPAPGTPAPATPAPATPAPATPAPTTVEFLGNTTQLTPFVAENEGLFQGVSVDVIRVGFGEQNSLFATGNYPLTAMAPWEVVQANDQGDDLAFVSTTGGFFAHNPLLIRKSDEGTYTTIEDLRGRRIGSPGSATASWGAFATIMKQLHDIDVSTYFEVIEAETGVLLPLLETGEIDAAVTFGPQRLIADAHPEKFVVFLSFYDHWLEETGQPLLTTGLVARREWLDQNPDLAQAVVEGHDAAVEWMADNADALTEPPYRDWMEAAGWLSEPGVTEAFLQMLRTKLYIATSEPYTQAWIDNQYEFIQNGVGVLVDEVPPIETIFYPPGS